MACIVYDATATSATVLVFGWSFLTLLSALLRGFTGYLLIRYLSTGAAAFTLILASFLIVGGLFRAVGAEVVKFPRWGWSVFSGIVSVALGIMLLAQMPASSVWFIGFVIGVVRRAA